MTSLFLAGSSHKNTALPFIEAGRAGRGAVLLPNGKSLLASLLAQPQKPGLGVPPSLLLSSRIYKGQKCLKGRTWDRAKGNPFAFIFHPCVPIATFPPARFLCCFASANSDD